MVVFPGIIDGIPAFTVKVNTKIPARRAASSARSTSRTWRPATCWRSWTPSSSRAERTALAGALAADVLARRDVPRVAVIGAGVQGEAQVRALQLVRRVERVDVVDSVPARAEAYAARVGPALGVEVVARERVADAVRDADDHHHGDVVEAAIPHASDGTRRRPHHGGRRGRAGQGRGGRGTHRELPVRCDDRDLATSMGAIAGAGLGPDAIHAELGEVIAGVKRGRTRADQITIFGSVGLAFQDLAAAWQVYGRAKRRHGNRDRARRLTLRSTMTGLLNVQERAAHPAAASPVPSASATAQQQVSGIRSARSCAMAPAARSAAVCILMPETSY